MRLLPFATTFAIAATLVTAATPVSAAEPAPYMVKNIRPGQLSSNPTDLTSIGDRLFFTAKDGSHGREPWVSDGTSAGTHIVKNISPGSYSSNARDYTLVGDRVFFTAQDGSGRELWVTDGTAAGTSRVRDIRVGGKSSKPSELTALGDVLYFTANDGPHGQELWKSDGTAAGTVMVSDLEPGKPGSAPTELTAYENRIYFVMPIPEPGAMSPCCALYRTDGTEAGTAKVLDKDGAGIALAHDLTVSGSMLYFAANRPGENFRGSHLWRTNGTASGTRSVSPDLAPENLTDVNGTLFFTSIDAARHGLWKSNGSALNTLMIQPFNNPYQLRNIGGVLFFTTLEADGSQGFLVSDGTPQGTLGWRAWNTAYYSIVELTGVPGVAVLSVSGMLWYGECYPSINSCIDYVWDRPVQPGSAGGVDNVAQLTTVGQTVFYVADSGYGRELFAYEPGVPDGQ